MFCAIITNTMLIKANSINHLQKPKTSKDFKSGKHNSTQRIICFYLELFHAHIQFFSFSYLHCIQLAHIMATVLPDQKHFSISYRKTNKFIMESFKLLIGWNLKLIHAVTLAQSLIRCCLLMETASPMSHRYSLGMRSNTKLQCVLCLRNIQMRPLLWILHLSNQGMNPKNIFL